MISQVHHTIINKAHSIVKMVEQSEEMIRFKQAEDKINHHADAQALIFIVRAKRNAYSQTSLRLGYEHPQSVKAKNELDETMDKIADIPLIEQYQQAQEELNDLIQGVTRTILNTLSPDVPVEIYDDEVVGGCGSASGGCGSGNCKH